MSHCPLKSLPLSRWTRLTTSGLHVPPSHSAGEVPATLTPQFSVFSGALWTMSGLSTQVTAYLYPLAPLLLAGCPLWLPASATAFSVCPTLFVHVHVLIVFSEPQLLRELPVLPPSSALHSADFLFLTISGPFVSLAIPPSGFCPRLSPLVVSQVPEQPVLLVIPFPNTVLCNQVV